MKVIIAGSRDLPIQVPDIEQVVKETGWNVTEVISGLSGNVDEMAVQYASHIGVPSTGFEANWKKHGKAAGPIRNQVMAEYGEALIALWDGESRGTDNMIKEATKRGLPVHVEWIWPEKEKSPRKSIVNREEG